MKASQEIKEKIKQWEGLRLQAYRCPAGVLTIGYGHTGSDVTAGMKITEAEADMLLDADLGYFERGVEQAFPGLGQRQYDALVSFAYNLGLGALQNSTLARKVKADPGDPSIAAEFRRWVRAGGKVMPGLVKRREAEAQWYFKPDMP